MKDLFHNVVLCLLVVLYVSSCVDAHRGGGRYGYRRRLADGRQIGSSRRYLRPIRREWGNGPEGDRGGFRRRPQMDFGVRFQGRPFRRRLDFPRFQRGSGRRLRNRNMRPRALGRPFMGPQNPRNVNGQNNVGPRNQINFNGQNNMGPTSQMNFNGQNDMGPQNQMDFNGQNDMGPQNEMNLNGQNNMGPQNQMNTNDQNNGNNFNFFDTAGGGPFGGNNDGHLTQGNMANFDGGFQTTDGINFHPSDQLNQAGHFNQGLNVGGLNSQFQDHTGGSVVNVDNFGVPGVSFDGSLSGQTRAGVVQSNIGSGVFGNQGNQLNTGLVGFQGRVPWALPVCQAPNILLCQDWPQGRDPSNAHSCHGDCQTDGCEVPCLCVCEQPPRVFVAQLSNTSPSSGISSQGMSVGQVAGNTQLRAPAIPFLTGNSASIPSIPSLGPSGDNSILIPAPNIDFASAFPGFSFRGVNTDRNSLNGFLPDGGSFSSLNPAGSSLGGVQLLGDGFTAGINNGNGLGSGSVNTGLPIDSVPVSAQFGGPLGNLDQLSLANSAPFGLSLPSTPVALPVIDAGIATQSIQKPVVVHDRTAPLVAQAQLGNTQIQTALDPAAALRFSIAEARSKVNDAVSNFKDAQSHRQDKIKDVLNNPAESIKFFGSPTALTNLLTGVNDPTLTNAVKELAFVTGTSLTGAGTKDPFSFATAGGSVIDPDLAMLGVNANSGMSVQSSGQTGSVASSLPPGNTKAVNSALDMVGFASGSGMDAGLTMMAAIAMADPAFGTVPGSNTGIHVAPRSATSSAIIGASIAGGAKASTIFTPLGQMNTGAGLGLATTSAKTGASLTGFTPLGQINTGAAPGAATFSAKTGAAFAGGAKDSFSFTPLGQMNTGAAPRAGISSGKNGASLTGGAKASSSFTPLGQINTGAAPGAGISSGKNGAFLLGGAKASSSFTPLGLITTGAAPGAGISLAKTGAAFAGGAKASSSFTPLGQINTGAAPGAGISSGKNGASLLGGAKASSSFTPLGLITTGAAPGAGISLAKTGAAFAGGAKASSSFTPLGQINTGAAPGAGISSGKNGASLLGGAKASSSFTPLGLITTGAAPGAGISLAKTGAAFAGGAKASSSFTPLGQINTGAAPGAATFSAETGAAFAGGAKDSFIFTPLGQMNTGAGLGSAISLGKSGTSVNGGAKASTNFTPLGQVGTARLAPVDKSQRASSAKLKGKPSSQQTTISKSTSSSTTSTGGKAANTNSGGKAFVDTKVGGSAGNGAVLSSLNTAGNTIKADSANMMSGANIIDRFVNFNTANTASLGTNSANGASASTGLGTAKQRGGLSSGATTGKGGAVSGTKSAKSGVSGLVKKTTDEVLKMSAARLGNQQDFMKSFLAGTVSATDPLVKKVTVGECRAKRQLLWCDPAGVWVGTPGVTDWCLLNCMSDMCDFKRCACSCVEDKVFQMKYDVLAASGKVKA